jgi:hypothetical protein
MVRPNFTAANLIGGKVRVEGISDDDLSDVIDIRVLLVQEQHIAGGFVDKEQASASVDKVTTAWHAELAAADFHTGPAVAFGVELRRENFATFSWAQPMTIE